MQTITTQDKINNLKARLAEAMKKGNKREIALYTKAIKTQEFWA